MKISNLKESVEYVIKNNEGNEMLEYNVEESLVSREWYEALLEKVKPLKPKRIIDIGSNINLYGYLFANEGIEYIGIEKEKDLNPVETDMIKFVEKDYLQVREEYKDDIIISCLCVGCLVDIKYVKAKRLFIEAGLNENGKYKCIAKEVLLKGDNYEEKI